MKAFFVISFLLMAIASFAQADAIRAARSYRSGDFTQSAQQYRKALQKDPKQPSLLYNAGNAGYRAQQEAEAIRLYEEAAMNATSPITRSNSWYNAGVVHHQAGRLQEAITDYKQALITDPDHADARHNLQLALAARKKQQQANSPKPQQKQPKPQPPSSLSKKQAEQLLRALEQREKEIRKEMQQKAPSPAQPEKDW